MTGATAEFAEPFCEAAFPWRFRFLEFWKNGKIVKGSIENSKAVISD